MSQAPGAGGDPAVNSVRGGIFTKADQLAQQAHNNRKLLDIAGKWNGAFG